MNRLPDIDLLDDGLLRLDATMSAPEAHGALCGMLCARGGVELSDWMRHVLGDEQAGGEGLRELSVQLAELHQASMAQINASDAAFDLLLPDDESGLEERADALAAWCQGFVYGLAVGGVSEEDQLPEDSRELLHDFIEISHAVYEPDEGTGPDEADEIAFAEIVEYVRTGVLLINEELQPMQASPTLH